VGKKNEDAGTVRRSSQKTKRRNWNREVDFEKSKRRVGWLDTGYSAFVAILLEEKGSGKSKYRRGKGRIGSNTEQGYNGKMGDQHVSLK